MGKEAASDALAPAEQMMRKEAPAVPPYQCVGEMRVAKFLLPEVDSAYQALVEDVALMLKALHGKSGRTVEVTRVSGPATAKVGNVYEVRQSYRKGAKMVVSEWGAEIAELERNQTIVLKEWSETTDAARETLARSREVPGDRLLRIDLEEHDGQCLVSITQPEIAKAEQTGWWCCGGGSDDEDSLNRRIILAEAAQLRIFAESWKPSKGASQPKKVKTSSMKKKKAEAGEEKKAQSGEGR